MRPEDERPRDDAGGGRPFGEPFSQHCTGTGWPRPSVAEGRRERGRPVLTAPDRFRADPCERQVEGKQACAAGCPMVEEAP